MTNINYSEKTNQELVNEIKNIDVCIQRLSRHISKNNPNLYNEILHRTNFLDTSNIGKISIQARIYCLEHNLTETPECNHPKCNNKVKWHCGSRAFSQYCSQDCMNDDPQIVLKRKHTCKVRFGTENPMQLGEILEKQRQTCIRRLGVDNPSRSREIQDKRKKTCLVKFNGETYFRSQQFKEAKQRYLDEHNVVNVSQIPEIYNKIRQTHEEKYGGIGYASDELRKKSYDTNKELHGDEHYSNIEQGMRTYMEQHDGAKNYLQTKQGKEQYKKTCNEKYNVDHISQLQWIQDKVKSTKQHRYGDPNYNNREKARNTTMEKYDVEYYTQSIEYHKTKKHKFISPKYPIVTFDSTWEFLVYDFLTDHNIQFEYQVEPIEYEYDGKTHKYFPDFRVNDKIYEVKGDNFFRINESTGKEEMYCTWRNPEWTDEYYEWRCGLEEAKHQCMIANNVTILRQSQIKNLTIEMFK